jgi:hypothetical protein
VTPARRNGLAIFALNQQAGGWFVLISIMQLPRRHQAEPRPDQPSSWDIDAAAFPEQGSDADKLKFLLRYAILAPSNHNTQPWLFALYDDHVDVIADHARSLPAADPFDRELVISCGAALAFVQAAAAGFGCDLDVRRFPAPENGDLLARVSLKHKHGAGAAPNSRLLEAILRRRTNRNAFDSRPLSVREREVIDLAMQQAGAQTSWIDDPTERQRLARMIMNADKMQFESAAFLRELAAWIRPPRTSARDGIPANAVGISGFASYVAPLVVRTFDLGDGKAARDQELMQGSPGIVVISTPFDQEHDWLRCGEALGFALLDAELLGLKASYLNQPCEVSELRFQLSLFDSVKGHPQLILRFGYAASVPPSPRRRLEEVMRDQRMRVP